MTAAMPERLKVAALDECAETGKLVRLKRRVPRMLAQEPVPEVLDRLV